MIRVRVQWGIQQHVKSIIGRRSVRVEGQLVWPVAEQGVMLSDPNRHNVRTGNQDHRRGLPETTRTFCQLTHTAGNKLQAGGGLPGSS